MLQRDLNRGLTIGGIDLLKAVEPAGHSPSGEIRHARRMGEMGVGQVLDARKKVERVASGELAAAYVVDDKPSPRLPIWQAKVRALTTLARMLSLSPGGRVPTKAPEATEPTSYYSRLALEHRDDRN